MRALVPKDIPDTRTAMTPLRQVNIGFAQSDGLSVTAWVDTATGRLVQLNQHRPGMRPSECK
jgi:hypothetical protein